MNKIIAAVSMVFAILICSTPATIAQTVHVTISGVKTTRGQIILSVFTSNQDFKNEHPVKTFKLSKDSLIKGTLNFSFNLQPGIYGLALLDDENKNDVMDKSFLRIPKEGFGFSNYYLTGMHKPIFDDFKFVMKGEPAKIEMRLRYF